MVSLMSDHYFSAAPGSAHNRRQLRVSLGGQERLLNTDSGIFSPEGIDKGAAVLLAEAPAPASDGDLLDIGCGWGPIALTLALKSPQARIHAVDVNERSLALTAENAAALGLGNVQVSQPDELDPSIRFQTIWSNPPIRVGKDVLHHILRTWLPRLTPSGTAYLVVQKNLGSDSLQRWITEEFADLEVRRFSTAKSFRILEVRHRD
ncbi:16S rRNA m2G1207 methyltransferase [Renibacterium salmoninarum ATCC 33209]|uniref:16S rRNA m2G1207 methyltransferase n=1 Tax=Renibacterium salmoninarum (strain ATCC 33209 / DSM 20767 / JCM 11484 / NBRC 15589 / NCIMB 2235) TaxID=288705 RepID=A9WQ51_RENSM|nr:16S rRNA m2G1207 methyltransferase [Renibacterium salmoninarum ATCC 33209]